MSGGFDLEMPIIVPIFVITNRENRVEVRFA